MHDLEYWLVLPNIIDDCYNRLLLNSSDCYDFSCVPLHFYRSAIHGLYNSQAHFMHTMCAHGMQGVLCIVDFGS